MRGKLYSESEVVILDIPADVRFIDMTGLRFGRLLILGFAGRNDKSMWFCKCDCGNIIRALSNNLKKGDTTSCGCVHSKRTSETHKTHGQSGRNATKEYSIWGKMIGRTQNLKDPDYGGRGIKVCDRWRSFENFFEDMGKCPSKTHSIERDDVNGNYCPENCRWATQVEQANNKRNNHPITFRGKTQNIGQWAAELGIGGSTIKRRINLGWSIEMALTEPVSYIRLSSRIKLNQQ